MPHSTPPLALRSPHANLPQDFALVIGIQAVDQRVPLRPPAGSCLCVDHHPGRTKIQIRPQVLVARQAPLNISSGRTIDPQDDIFSGACLATKTCGPDFDFGASVMLVDAGGKSLLVAGQKSGLVYGLDPDDQGKILWQIRVGKGSTNGGVLWGMASDGRLAYAANSDVARSNRKPADLADLRDRDLYPAKGGGLHGDPAYRRQPDLVRRATPLRSTQDRLQSGPARRRYRNSRRRLLRLRGWPHASLLGREWLGALGFRHRAGVSNSERRSRARWIHRRPWRRGGERVFT